jgi:hypothetical protein
MLPTAIIALMIMSYGMLRRVVWYKFTDVSEVLTASSIDLMTLVTTRAMEAVNTFATPVTFWHTKRCNIPEHSNLPQLFHVPNADV